MSSRAVVRRWVRAQVDEDAARRLSLDTNLSLRTSRLLVSRGIADKVEAARYLDPQLCDMPDPFSMKDIGRAARRVADAMARGERITLYGDYDVDGVTSSTLLSSFLRHHGVEAGVYIPKRLIEGYGLNRDAVEKLADEGTQLLITLDCGITAADEIQRANAKGIDTIVVDHHRCPPALPPAFATLNPHQDDCRYPEKVLAAVGVCFNLIVALRKELRDRGVYQSGVDEPNLRRALDLVALGTVADLVPLVGVNRLLTRFGLQELQWARRPGIRALMEVSRVKPERCASSDLGFKLGPRVNAAGRLDDATVGVRLLLSDDMAEARRLAAALDDANGSRRRIDGEVFQEAVAMVEALPSLPPALVLARSAWHPGVVGIVASKLVERYDRPTVLIGEGGRGSARTARGIHLYNALSDVAGYLTKFGGHRAAAGLRIQHDKIEPFREALIRRVAGESGMEQATESILVFDDDLSPDEIDERCFAELCRLEPFGMGNPEPLFRAQQVRVRSRRVVGGEHLKLRLVEGMSGGLGAIAFKFGDLEASVVPGAPIDVAFHLEENEFQGNRSLELRIRDIRV